MRLFGQPISRQLRQEIVNLARSVFDRAPLQRPIKAVEFAMEDEPELVVVHEADLRWGGERLRIAITEAYARPPFEWLMEITSDVGETDYFKHYLVLEDDIVLAQRKVLTPVDDEEARVILADLRLAQDHLES